MTQSVHLFVYYMDLEQLQKMNSGDGSAKKNRPHKRRKESNDAEETGDKMKSIVVADVENLTQCMDLEQLQNMNSRDGVKTRKASNDGEETKDKMKSIVVADVENHTGCMDLEQLQNMNSSDGVKTRKASNDSGGVEVDEVEKLSYIEELWGHDHTICVKDRDREGGEEEELEMLELMMHDYNSLMERMEVMKMDEEQRKKKEEKRKKLLMRFQELESMP